MIAALEQWCDAFLYTHIDSEGLMQGIPLETISPLRSATRKQLIVAGGIASSEQIDQLDAMQLMPWLEWRSIRGGLHSLSSRDFEVVAPWRKVETKSAISRTCASR